MMHLEMGGNDVFRVSRSPSPISDDMDINVVFSSKFRPILIDKFTASGTSGTILFSKPYVTNPVVIAYPTPYWDYQTQWYTLSGNIQPSWNTSYEAGFVVVVYPTYLTWGGSDGGAKTFFVIGAVV